MSIHYFQTIVRRTAGHNIFQPQKTPDTVFNMHHQFAHAQRRHIGDKIFGTCFFDLAMLTLAQNILLRYQAIFIISEPVRQLGNNQRNFLLRANLQSFRPTCSQCRVFDVIIRHQ